MPLYEYYCEQCDAEFIKTVSMPDRNSDKARTCPECSSLGIKLLARKTICRVKANPPTPAQVKKQKAAAAEKRMDAYLKKMPNDENKTYMENFIKAGRYGKKAKPGDKQHQMVMDKIKHDRRNRKTNST